MDQAAISLVTPAVSEVPKPCAKGPQAVRQPPKP